jgi:hypothetical protein
LNTSGRCRGSSGSSSTPADHPQRNPGRIKQVHADAATGAAQLTHRRVVRRRQLLHVGAVGRLERRATNRDLAPLRITTQCVPTRAPRRYKVSAVRAAGDNPKSCANRSAASEVRLLELQPRQVLNLDHRVLRPPGAVTPLSALLAVAGPLCRSLRLTHGLDLSSVLI